MYERILNESFQLFIQYGIRSITMDDIAKHMGISKRTIYENFRDKDDLLHAALINHKKEQNRKHISDFDREVKKLSKSIKKK